MNDSDIRTVALLYPGDRAMRDRADPAESRFAVLFEALAAAGVHAIPAVYHDDFADEVRAQLLAVQGVLVWHNPIEGGRRRDALDALLREVGGAGVWVSTHPDAIAKLGTKDVLVDTRQLPFGSDAHRINSLVQLDADLPRRLHDGPRVLKQRRGHSGIGVWRVEWADAGAQQVRVHHAQRGSEEQLLDWPSWRQTLAPYFDADAGGHMVDQAWQPRLHEGMWRAYLVGERVGGFGEQAINALYPTGPGEPAVQPGQRLYFDADEPRFQNLKSKLEGGWIALLCQCVGLAPAQLPLLWDCDFMFGEPSAGEPQRFVLCEINVSSVSPFPPSAIAPLVAAVQQRLGPLSG
jgi:hypothetical protein